MGKIILFEINLQNSSSVYHKGDIINGTVNIDLQVPMELLGINLHFRGRASVASRNKYGTNIDYYFLDEKRTIWGDGN